MLSFHTDKCGSVGLSRRAMLRVGGLGALGFGAGATAQRAAAGGAAEAKRGRARSIVFVTLYGGPPQTETFDMKPQAPLEARGPFKPISTNNPGVQICEHLPRLADACRSLYAGAQF